MKALPIIFLQFFTISLFAQYAPGLTWKKVFGGKKSEKTHDLITTYEGNIALIGETTSKPKKAQDALWILLDAQGNPKKQIQLGGEKEDILKAIVQTYDGGFALAGHTKSIGLGKEDGWLVKLDQNGDTLWQKAVGSPRSEAFNDLIQTSDGGLLAVGYHEPQKNGRRDMWVYRTYEDGTLRWQRSFGNRSYDEARAVVEAENGYLAIAGVTASGKGGRNIWLFILDEYGNPVQHRIFGERQWEEVFDLVATSDGGFALTGFAKTTNKNKGHGLKDAWLIKTAADGEMIWQTTLGGRNNDSAFGITETTDGGLVLVGYTFSHLIGANTSSALLIKVDKNGKKVWEQDPPFGGKGNDKLEAITLLPNGCLIAAGTTASKQEKAQKQDIWVMRLNCDFDINTAIPTKLAITNVQFKDNGDHTLEEQEQAFFYITLENQGQQDAYNLDIFLQEKSGAKGLQFRTFQKLGFLAAGKSKLVRIPVQGIEGLIMGDAIFECYATDASRAKTIPIEIPIPTKPLNIPSNYLDIVWVSPNPLLSTDYKTMHKSNTLSIKLRAISDKPLQRKNFTVLLNGEPYKVGQKAGEASLRSKGRARQVFTYEYINQVELQVGLNNIEVVVGNDSRKVSSQIFEVLFSNKPNLHILSIGIDHDDLNFTKKDALDFARSFENQEGRLFDKVFLNTLVSGQRNKAGIIQTNGDIIKKAFRDLKDNYNYTVYKRDLLVVFLSSHGRAINNDFKIVPSDFEIIGEDALIDYEKDIIKQLEAINCHKLIFIDACQSGSSSKEELVGASFNEIDKKRARALVNLSQDYQNTGTLASCQSTESSWEDPTWENGAFTEAIVGAFNNESYQDPQGQFNVTKDNNIVTVGELYHYLQRRVPQMLKDVGKKGNQNPFIPTQQLQKIKDLPIYEID